MFSSFVIFVCSIIIEEFYKCLNAGKKGLKYALRIDKNEKWYIVFDGLPISRDVTVRSQRLYLWKNGFNKQVLE